jgi:hypothetical protein
MSTTCQGYPCDVVNGQRPTTPRIAVIADNSFFTGIGGFNIHKKRTRGFSSTVWKNERTIITISALTADSLNSLLNKTQKVNYIVMLYFFHKESKQLLPA